MEKQIKPIVYIGVVKDNRLLLLDYLQAPNPEKTGWWIPAPELQFGEDPEERVKKFAEEMGIAINRLKLVASESFVLPGGWHLIWHYQIETASEPAQHANVRECKWVDKDELAGIGNLAHGAWEKKTGLRFMES